MRTKRLTVERAEEGFVLPYVLVVVFILALVSAVAVRSITSSSTIITELNEDMLAEQRLLSAEADTLFVFLTSVPVKGGIDTSHMVWTGEEVVDGFNVDRLLPGALWSAAGGERQSVSANGKVIVRYRDGAGFVPLNRNAPEMITRLLKGLGLKTVEAKSAAAKLGDFVDDNTIRRFQGGERADYRLKGLPVPENAPLRVHEEIYRIMDWDKLIPPKRYQQLLNITTLTASSTYYRKKFLSSEAVKALGLDEPNGAVRSIVPNTIDLFDDITSTVEMPSKIGRFTYSTLTVPGLIRIRAIELERTSGAPDRPFKRHVVFEETINVGDNSDKYDTKKAIPPVFTAPDRSAE
jgi:Type II secretion system (T2SS), protein K